MAETCYEVQGAILGHLRESKGYRDERWNPSKSQGNLRSHRGLCHVEVIVQRYGQGAFYYARQDLEILCDVIWFTSS